MRVLLHDLPIELFEAYFPKIPKDITVVSDNGNIKNCIGCFSCWTKTPGKCVLKDGYEDMGKLLSQAEEFIIISESSFGTYSPFVKNIWDRSLPYLLPFFTKINGETHHKVRYHNHFQLSVYFYGEEITQQEKENAQQLVKANGMNFHVKDSNTVFISSRNSLGKEMVL